MLLKITVQLLSQIKFTNNQQKISAEFWALKIDFKDKMYN